MVDINKVSSTVDVTVRIELSGAPEMNSRLSNRLIQPGLAVFQYRLIMTDAGPVWRCYTADVHGTRILKPAPDGSVRLGKEVMRNSWSGYLDNAPEWVVNLINEVRPNGAPEVASDLK